jgi:hypothetical protein
LAKTAEGVYVSDITFGELSWLRGQWLDRLAAIDADIALLEKRLAVATRRDDPRVKAAIIEALGRPQRPAAAVQHHPPERFQRRQPLQLALSGPVLSSASLYYRHVNQAERWRSILINRIRRHHTERIHRFAIPAAILL